MAAPQLWFLLYNASLKPGTAPSPFTSADPISALVLVLPGRARRLPTWILVWVALYSRLSPSCLTGCSPPPPVGRFRPACASVPPVVPSASPPPPPGDLRRIDNPDGNVHSIFANQQITGRDWYPVLNVPKLKVVLSCEPRVGTKQCLHLFMIVQLVTFYSLQFAHRLGLAKFYKLFLSVPESGSGSKNLVPNFRKLKNPQENYKFNFYSQKLSNKTFI